MDRPHSLPLSIALHLFPGVLIVAAYLAIASPLVEALGYPPFLGWVVAMCVALVPFQLGLLLYLGYKRNGRLSLRGVVEYTDRPLSRGRLIGTVAGLIVAVFVASIVLAPVDSAIYQALFTWMPPGTLTGYPRSVAVTTFAVSIVFVGLIGPLVEELYFRGFLLPRMAHLGAQAPIINAVLFSLYHFWTPWQFFSRIGFFLPVIWVTWRTRDLRVSVWVHSLSNTLVQVLFLATLIWPS